MKWPSWRQNIYEPALTEVRQCWCFTYHTHQSISPPRVNNEPLNFYCLQSGFIALLPSGSFSPFESVSTGTEMRKDWNTEAKGLCEKIIIWKWEHFKNSSVLVSYKVHPHRSGLYAGHVPFKKKLLEYVRVHGERGYFINIYCNCNV